MTTADPIARVVADARSGRVRNLLAAHGPAGSTLYAEGLAHWRDEPVIIDATPIYESLTETPKPVYIYEDHPCISPPWPSAAYCYVNEHGNVIAMTVASRETSDPAVRRRLKTVKPAHPVEWDRVRWLAEVLVWVGGHGGDGRPFDTAGPAHSWLISIYGNGEPADITWVHLIRELDMERWDMAQMVLLGSLNFLACKNVEATEPVRPRAERRRLARAGVTVKTLTVRPPGPLRRSAGSREEPAGAPLTTVRGHFATYGEEYNRGLLFGKYSGRFWVPQYAKGSAGNGEIRKSYLLDPR